MRNPRDIWGGMCAGSGKKVAALSVLVIGFLSVHVTPDRNTVQKSGPKHGPRAAAYSSAAKSINAFCADYYGKVGKKGQNIVFSPLSISTCFAMSYAGARGDTRKQMASVFHYRSPPATVLRDMNNVWQGPEASASATLDYGNAAWLDNDFSVSRSYQKRLNTFGVGHLKRTNLASRGTAGGKIDAWVNKVTRGKIPRLSGGMNFNQSTRLVLTSALYFKGKWKDRFPEEKTRKRRFTLASGERTKVPMMHQTGQFKYGRVDGAKVLEMPYRDCSLSMLMFLPDPDRSPAEVMKELTPEELARAPKSLALHEVEVYLPRFTMSGNVPVKRPLKSLGLRAAFDITKADLGGINQAERLFIDSVVHRSYIKVDEEGTEAAAATGVSTGCGGPAPAGKKVTFRADRPFLFTVRDGKSGAYFFFGKVANPEPTGF